MSHLEVGRKRQQIKRQYRYAFKQTTGVCLQNTTDYSPFGVTLDGRTIERGFYRRGFNGMEKDDELKGNGNSYTTEFRQLDPRVGRWFSVDPVIKPYISPYNSMSNNPIVKVDPKGDDDYYNYKGQYLYTDTKVSNDIRIIKQSTFNKLSAKHGFFAVVDKTKSYGNWLTDLTNNSKKVEIKDFEAGNKFSDMWRKSVERPIKEYAGYIVLDVKNAELRFEEINPTLQTSNSASDPYKAGDLFNGQEGVIVIANVHTHPDELNYINRVTDEQIFNAQYSVPSGDGNTAVQMGARYTIGVNNIDYHSPNGKMKSKNNLTSKEKATRGKFSILKHSLEQYGGKID